jgi:hypothetical protein
MSDVKQIHIEGLGANGSVYRRGAGRGTRSKKRNSGGGDSLPVEESVPVAAPAAAEPLPEPMTPIPAPEPLQTGGATHKRLVLSPKKKITKIVLTKKRIVPPAPSTAPAAVPQRKAARKITLRLAAHKRRITRARHIQREARTMPLEDVRKILVSKQIIKESSKAPEAILRQLYADTMSLSKGDGL